MVIIHIQLHIIHLFLALIADACLYSPAAPAEDISLIPQNVWRNVEALGSIKHDGKVEDFGKRVCQVLCRLRDEGDEAKEVLKDVLFPSSSKNYDPDFANTRESILQVLANVTAVHSYFDLFSKKIDQDDIVRVELIEERKRKLLVIRVKRFRLTL